VPANLDANYSDHFSTAKNDEIIFFGRMPKDNVGSVFDLFLKNRAPAGFKEVKNFSDHVRSRGKSFYYLMDAVCLNNIEFLRGPHFKLIEFLKKVHDCGCDGVIVSSLMLMQIIQKQFPKLKVIISPAARIDSRQSAETTFSQGADGIIYSFFLARDKNFLDMIHREFSEKLNIIYLNSGCYLHSIFCVRHLAEMSHFSQNFISHKMQSTDIAGLTCVAEKIKKPEKHLSAGFLPPQLFDGFKNEYPELDYFISDSNATFDSVKLVFDAYFRAAPVQNVFSIVKNYFCLSNLRFNSIKLGPEAAAKIVDESIGLRSLCAYLDCDKCLKCLDFFKKHGSYDESEREKILKEIKELEINCAYQLG